MAEGTETEAQEHAYAYFDRDLSWLSFNYRVLQEAGDKHVPLYERIKFLAIYSSNLDEFFRVRVAGLRSLIEIDKKKINKQLGLKPKKLLKTILEQVNKELNEFGRIKREEIIPELKNNNIVLYRGEPVREEHKGEMKHYLMSKILSYLQPVLMSDDVEQKEFLENRALYFAIALDKTNEEGVEEDVYAYLNIPTDHLPRFSSLSKLGDTYYYIAVDDIIRENLNYLFPGYTIKGCYSIKLNRDAELNIDDEYSGDLVDKISKQIKKRDLGLPTRFLYDSAIPKPFLKFLQDKLGLNKVDMVAGGRYHNMNDLFGLGNPLRPNLENEDLPVIHKKGLDQHVSIFDAISEKEYMLHFPYQSYDYVLQFFNHAAIDPNVEEIKATFYRVASNSFIINALISAAKNGKKVTVFVEIKARFDEANNLKWAAKMEEAGVKIIYSIPGLKVHAKVALVYRREKSGEQVGYAFFGTGNFNEKTASIYADHGLLTADKTMTDELNEVFVYLDERKEIKPFNHILVSQFNLQPQFLAMIDREIEHVRNGKKAHITIKVNNLEDEVMINKLYEASEAGVKIDMLVRSICRIVPGVKGMSENIRVIRIVDRYLEHARVFVFHNDGSDDLYMGSADWMRRNLYRRIEVVFPIYNPALKAEIQKMIELQLNDNTKACLLNEELENVRVKRDSASIRAQTDFYKWLRARESEE